jgi:hypothetical protein
MSCVRSTRFSRPRLKFSQTAATSRSRRNIQPATELKPASTVLAQFSPSTATPAVTEELSLSAPPPSTPSAASRVPEDVYASPHTFFRPPPSEALEIFNRPPSPDTKEAIRALRSRSKEQYPPISSMSTLPYASQASSLSNGSEIPSNGATLPAVNGNIATQEAAGPAASNFPAPVTPRATRFSASSVLMGPQYNMTPMNGATPPAAASSLSGSPYVVQKTIKLGSKKGKSKAMDSGAEQHLVSGQRQYPPSFGLDLPDSS